MVALALDCAAGVVVGAAQTGENGFGLGQFGGWDYLPRVLWLSVSRVLATRASLAMTCVALTVVLHRASKRAPGVVVLDRRPYLLGAAALLGYVPAFGFAVVGGALTWTVVFSQSMAAFVQVLRNAWSWRDVAYGVGFAIVNGVMLTVAAPALGRAVVAWRRGLLVKAIAIYVALMLVDTAESYVGVNLLGG